MIENHDQHFGPIFRRISQAFKHDRNELFARYDLTSSQTEVMIYLERNHDKKICQKDIEKHLNLKNPTVTGLLKRMIAKKFIIRQSDPVDKRFKYIYLTKKALTIMEQIKNHVLTLEENVIAGFSQEEIVQLQLLLKRVLANMTQK